MEDNNNSVSLDALLGELQTLNQGVASENEKIDQLVQYLIVKDQKEKEAAEAAEKQAAKEKAEQVEADRISAENEQKAAEEQAEADQQAAEEQAAQDQEVTETYTELLTDIRDQSVLMNQLLAVQGVFIGIVIGLLFMKSIFDRIFK